VDVHLLGILLSVVWSYWWLSWEGRVFLLRIKCTQRTPRDSHILSSAEIVSRKVHLGGRWGGRWSILLSNNQLCYHGAVSHCMARSFAWWRLHVHFLRTGDMWLNDQGRNMRGFAWT
jgi:hypothetical protein